MRDMDATTLDNDEIALTRGLIAHHGMWGEHSDHPSAEWRERVRARQTLLGYWEWVTRRMIDADRQR